MTSTIITRIALAGDWALVIAVVISALFLPSFALALGCWSGTSQSFQAVYLFLWYLASVQGGYDAISKCSLESSSDSDPGYAGNAIGVLCRDLGVGAKSASNHSSAVLENRRAINRAGSAQNV